MGIKIHYIDPNTSFDALILIMYTVTMPAIRKKTDKRQANRWCSSRGDVDLGLMEVLVCWLTTQVVHLLLLQQADGIVVCFQHQLCLWVLAGHSLTAEDLLWLDHFILLCACHKEYGDERPENTALWPLKVRSVYITMLKWREVPGYGLFLGKILSLFPILPRTIAEK